MAVTWEEPGPRKTYGPGVRGAWQEEADQLQDDPGRWGVVTVYGKDERNRGRAQALTTHIRNGGYRAFRPKGSFESAYRKQDDGTHKVFARYVA